MARSKLEEIAQDALEHENEASESSSKLVSQADIQEQEPRSLPIHNSPAVRIPPEILTDIFSYHTSAEIIITGVQAPMLAFSQVCQYWRSVTMSFPELWSSFRLDLPSVTRRNATVVGLCLQRSQTAPLKLHITSLKPVIQWNPGPLTSWTTPPSPPRDNEPIHSINIEKPGRSLFDELVKQSHRWRSLVLDVRDDFFEHNFPEYRLEKYYSGISFPQLEAADLVNTGMSTGALDMRLFRLHLRSANTRCCFAKALKTAPNVKVLRIRQLELTRASIHTLLYPVPMSPVKSLAITRSNGFISCLLSDVPNLEELVLEEHGPSWRDVPNPVITHDTLTHLSIHFETFDILKSSLSTLTLPQLSSLTLTGQKSLHFYWNPNRGPGQESQRPLWPQNEFISFLQRSRCSLVELKLGMFEISDVLLMEIFRLTPDLVYLSFHEYAVSFTPALFSLLTITISESESELKADAPSPLPKLRHLDLHLDRQTLTPNEMEGIVTMVESRSRLGTSRDDEFDKGVARLNAFGLSYSVHDKKGDPMNQAEIQARLRELYEHGMDISVIRKAGSKRMEMSVV